MECFKENRSNSPTTPSGKLFGKLKVFPKPKSLFGQCLRGRSLHLTTSENEASKGPEPVLCVQGLRKPFNSYLSHVNSHKIVGKPWLILSRLR